jgi:hypothetical protein
VALHFDLLAEQREAASQDQAVLSSPGVAIVCVKPCDEVHFARSLYVPEEAAAQIPARNGRVCMETGLGLLLSRRLKIKFTKSGGGCIGGRGGLMPAARISSSRSTSEGPSRVWLAQGDLDQSRNIVAYQLVD